MNNKSEYAENGTMQEGFFDKYHIPAWQYCRRNIGRMGEVPLTLECPMGR